MPRLTTKAGTIEAATPPLHQLNYATFREHVQARATTEPLDAEALLRQVVFEEPDALGYAIGKAKKADTLLGE